MSPIAALRRPSEYAETTYVDVAWDLDGNCYPLPDNLIDLAVPGTQYFFNLDADGNPPGIEFASPDAPTHYHAYIGTTRAGVRRQNDAPIPLRRRSFVASQPLLDDHAPNRGVSELPRPPAPRASTVPNKSAGFEEGVYPLRYVGVNARGERTLPSPTTFVTVAQGQSIRTDIPPPTSEEIVEWEFYLGTAGGSETTCRYQRSVRLRHNSSTTLNLPGPYRFGRLLPTVNETVLGQPGEVGVRRLRNYPPERGALQVGLYRFGATLLDANGETLLTVWSSPPRNINAPIPQSAFIVRLDPRGRPHRRYPGAERWKCFVLKDNIPHQAVNVFGRPDGSLLLDQSAIVQGYVDEVPEGVPWRLVQTETPEENTTGILAPENPPENVVPYSTSVPPPADYFSAVSWVRAGREGTVSPPTGPTTVATGRMLRISPKHPMNMIRNAEVSDVGADGVAAHHTVAVPGSAWQPNRAYAIGDIVKPTDTNYNGHFYAITAAGTSGNAEPAWRRARGASWVTDGVGYAERGSVTFAGGDVVMDASSGATAGASASVTTETVPISESAAPNDVTNFSGELEVTLATAGTHEVLLQHLDDANVVVASQMLASRTTVGSTHYDLSYGIASRVWPAGATKWQILHRMTGLDRRGTSAWRNRAAYPGDIRPRKWEIDPITYEADFSPGSETPFPLFSDGAIGVAPSYNGVPDAPTGRTLDPDGVPINQHYHLTGPTDPVRDDVHLVSYRQAVKPGVQYTLGVWARWRDLRGTQKPMFVTLRNTAGEEKKIGSLFSGSGAGVTGTSDWAERTITFTPPADYHEMIVSSQSIGPGEIVMQELSLSEGATALRGYGRADTATIKATLDTRTPRLAENAPPLFLRRLDFGIHDALTPQGDGQDFTATAIDDLISVTAHGYSAGTPVRVSGTTLPTPLTADTTYYVSSPLANTFKLSATSGGTAIDLTTDGSGEVYSHTSVAAQFRVGEETPLTGSYITDPALVPKGRYMEIFATLETAGRLFPVLRRGSLFVEYQLVHDTLTDSERAEIPGGVLVGSLGFPRVGPEYARERTEGGSFITQPVSDELGRLEGFTVVSFSDEASTYLSQNSGKEAFTVEGLEYVAPVRFDEAFVVGTNRLTARKFQTELGDRWLIQGTADTSACEVIETTEEAEDA